MTITRRKFLLQTAAGSAALAMPSVGAGIKTPLAAVESSGGGCVIPPQAWSWPVLKDPPEPATPALENLKDGGAWQGMPLGGFGTGGIVRNYRGAFSRWTLKTGALKHFCEPANMFAVRQRVGQRPPTAMALHPDYPALRRTKHAAPKKALSAWRWGLPSADCRYHALFPKAWHQYPASAEMPVAMTCEQFSPVLPGQYRETSLPVALFRWHLENTAREPMEVSLLFSLVNMNGWFDDFDDGLPARKNAGNFNRPVNTVLPGSSDQLCGVLLGGALEAGAMCEGRGQFCIAAAADERCRVTRITAFDPAGDGAEVWQPFAKDGTLQEGPASWMCDPGQRVAGAVCATVTLAPGERRTVPMALAWDLPIIAFGGGREHYRQYTRHVGRDGTHAAELASEALVHAGEWSRKIDAWHQGIIKSGDYPAWFYTTLFNEAYLLVDGYTVWTDGARERPGHDPFFGIIECPDYPFYCTLDLWSYGSFVLAQHWPDLERNVVRRFAKSILLDDPRNRKLASTKEIIANKKPGAAPHDFGQPKEDPPFLCNSYVHRDTNRWKDLNSHFVLTVLRDMRALNDAALLADCWPAVKRAIEYLAPFDADGDGLIENDGTPDQTMDNIPMKGVSAYCGGLWLAALHAAVTLGQQVGDATFVAQWSPVADRARTTFDRCLWRGDHYAFDTEGLYRDALFVDALFGIWYGQLCGLKDLVPAEKFRQHLLTVFKANYEGFHNGHYGAANITGGAQATATATENIFNTKDCQISEVLCGLNISFALQLEAAGLRAESQRVLQTVYDVVYRRYGLWFRTPAAWTVERKFRAILNLRPLVIFASQSTLR